MSSVSESSTDSSSGATRPLRVIQWATGNVGQASLRALIGNPAFDLVGVYVYSDDKEGRDVGELAGLEPAALRATHDREAILALDADAVRAAYRRWAGVYDAVFGGVSAFGRRRAVAAVRQTLVAMEYIHVRTDDRPSKRWKAFHARR